MSKTASTPMTAAAATTDAADMPWLARQASRLLHQPGHALLLQGPSGLGQFGLALYLARAWLCESRPPDAPAAVPCGHCAGCHAIAVRTHPDLLVLMPEAHQLELGWTVDSGDAADGEAKSATRRKPSRDIRVDAMRQMITFSQRTDSRGRGKVVLVYPAENMNAVTANALLKTLEEPPGGTRFLLVSDAADRLLPTIRSRCHTWAMQWPDAREAADWLHRHGVAEAQAATLLQIVGGRPLDALALAHSGMNVQDWLNLPQALAQGHAGLLAPLPPAQAVRVLQKLCHDLHSLLAGGAPRYFPPQSLAAWQPAADAPLATTAWAALGQWAQQLAQTARTAEHPLAPELMLASLVEQARNALHWGRRR